MDINIPTVLLPSYGDLPMPRFQTPGSVAMDLYAVANGQLHGHVPTVVRFGLVVAIPEGFEGQIRGRSGLATKGVFCHFGTIDRDYRGEVGAILTFSPSPQIGQSIFKYERGDRLAQLVIAPVATARLVDVDILPPTERDAGGFGSTGVARENP